MTLTACFQVPERNVEVELRVESGSTLALIGPNASGKSTVLSVIAGLLAAQGEARLNDRELLDLPAHKRHVALLAQQPRLFPRMTARQNVEFALRAQGRNIAEAGRWLDMVSAADLAARRPQELSGGQAQRVALARALATEPDLLLLDEPLAALDTSVAADIRHALREILADRSVVIVSHDVLDVALLADTVAVMDAGRIVEVGAAPEILRQPRTAFAADLSGLNLLQGTAATADSIDCGVGRLTGLGNLVPGTPAVATFPPAAVAVYTEQPHGSPRNVVEAQITSLTPQGQVIRVRTDAFDADLTPAAANELALRHAMTVFLVVKATEVRLSQA